MQHFNSKTPHAEILAQVKVGEKFLVSPTPGLVGLFFLQKTGPRSCRRVHLDRANAEELAQIRWALYTMKVDSIMFDEPWQNHVAMWQDYIDTTDDFLAGTGRA